MEASNNVPDLYFYDLFRPQYDSGSGLAITLTVALRSVSARLVRVVVRDATTRDVWIFPILPFVVVFLCSFTSVVAKSGY